jgi:hypothetical protein
MDKSVSLETMDFEFAIEPRFAKMLGMLKAIGRLLYFEKISALMTASTTS